MRKLSLLLILFLLSTKASFAQNPTSITQAMIAPIKVDYELPYPGLLPDNPLYSLRVIRDKVVNFLISDSLKKSEFNLLQADKRLNAGIFLEKKGNVSLALDTVSKAENYFDQAIVKLEEAKKQGQNIDEMVRRLNNALPRHRQEMEIFLQGANKDYKLRFERELARILDFEKRLGR